MQRGTIVLILFGVLAAGIVVGSQFIFSRPPLEVTIAVNPLAEDWVLAAADAYNGRDPVVNGNRRIRVRVETVEDVDVWNSGVDWSDGLLEEESTNRPTMWMPAASFSAAYVADDRRLPFADVEASTARTMMVWGGFTDTVTTFVDLPMLGFDWESVQRTTISDAWAAENGYINMAFTAPDQTISGLSVLLSGAASYHETGTLSGANLRDDGFRRWVLPVLESVPNMNSLGANPAQAIAQRGASLADVALLPESQWVMSVAAIGTPDQFTLSYPEYQLVLDFPLLLWDSDFTSDDERAAATNFRDWLMDDARQAGAADYGLRPAASEPTEIAQRFMDAQAYGVQLEPSYTELVAPSKSDILSLLTWYNQNS